MRNIHPNQVDCKVICACGATFTTKSTMPEFHAEVFNKKFGLNQENK